jgi:hypothetical protein
VEDGVCGVGRSDDDDESFFTDNDDDDDIGCAEIVDDGGVNNIIRQKSDRTIENGEN